ncbi:dihydrodipicolinate synthase family protein [Labrys monachus]|uniref:4-hydroxy-tetrahydrodipicolinate synthase n=1 Tax=Labrys monachus TaxID=217067 RepID=A0ABU0F8Y3_9HYPH|nr:dihydrodipicolinate synthase family protein [Labrys monachus]MDQ0390525.1 4-hydroxy-tetrahydrodipicolinate synthase [Labrys monachus]
MDRTSVDWAGPMPAITTPFHDDGRIDEAAFAANIDRLMKDGATGVVAGGCTGEFWALSHEERKRVYEISKEAMGGRGTLIVGTGAVTVDEAVALSRHAEKVGCDGALILPPYFVKLSDDEIFAHYADVTGAIGLPVLLYNIPGNAVNALTPALVSRLAGLDRVVAVKESSGDWNNYYGTALAVRDRLRVFCGPSSVFGVPAVDLGADGTIDCFPNVWSPGGLDLYFAPKRGDRVEAERVQALGRRLTDLFTSGGRTLYPATKAAMDMLGLPGGGKPRAPLRPLGGEARAGLEKGLRELGLL